MKFGNNCFLILTTVTSLAIFVACPDTNGQSVITGTVYEGTTNQPLPHVNVFFSSTSTGSTTSADGNFSFKASNRGKFELVASYIGYATWKIPIVIRQDSLFSFKITMVARTPELPALVVMADTSHRKKDYADFRRMFLGETPNASRCRILNPKDIYVYHDKSDNVLLAYAHVPIRVENKALGYLLHFELEKFKYNYGTGLLVLRGTPRFDDLHDGPPEEQRGRARSESYLGSLGHLMHSILADSLYEEDWEVFIEYHTRRPSFSYIDQKIEMYKKLYNKDSVTYYQRLKSLPEGGFLQSPYLHGYELLSDSNRYQFTFKGRLVVKYTKEMDGRLPLSKRKLGQVSQIDFLRGPITLYENSYFEPQEYLDISEYLAWAERVAEYVPLGFVPKKPEEK